MALEDCWFDRAVEIKIRAADGTLVRRGSGFMVAPGVILTALHVAVGNSAVPQRPVTCDVRLLEDINVMGGPEHTPYCKAELKWPAPGTALDQAGDAALLVVAANDRTASMIDCAALPVLKSRRGRAVAGVGMPAYARKIDPSGSTAGFRDINGRIGNRLDTIALVELTLDDQKHPEPAEWKGASGAVLLDAKGEVLVGILVHADHTGYDEVKSDPSRPLMIEMLSDFAETPGFQSVVNLDVIPEERASTDELPAKVIGEARKLLHLLDRTSQTKQVSRLLKNAATGKYRPIVLVSHMKEQDCPDIFVETLSAHLMAAFKDRRNCYWQPSDLSWRLGVPPQRAIAKLKSAIVEDVDAADDAGLDTALVAGQKKRLFAVRIDSEADTPAQETQEALKDLFLWWFARSECEGGPATLLLRIVDTLGDAQQCPKAKMVFSLVDSLFVGPPPLGDSEQVLEPLARCKMNDVLTWSDLSLKTSVGGYRDLIVRRLNTWVANYGGGGIPFPLSVIRSALL